MPSVVVKFFGFLGGAFVIFFPVGMVFNDARSWVLYALCLAFALGWARWADRRMRTTVLARDDDGVTVRYERRRKRSPEVPSRPADPAA